MTTFLISILAFSAFLTGYLFAICLATPIKRKRAVQWIKCKCGFHAPDVVRAEVGGRNVQRCMYCDVVLHEYRVTRQGAQKSPTIRRIY